MLGISTLAPKPCIRRFTPLHCQLLKLSIDYCIRLLSFTTERMHLSAHKLSRCYCVENKCLTVIFKRIHMNFKDVPLRNCTLLIAIVQRKTYWVILHQSSQYERIFANRLAMRNETIGNNIMTITKCLEQNMKSCVLWSTNMVVINLVQNCTTDD